MLNSLWTQTIRFKDIQQFWCVYEEIEKLSVFTKYSYLIAAYFFSTLPDPQKELMGSFLLAVWWGEAGRELKYLQDPKLWQKWTGHVKTMTKEKIGWWWAQANLCSPIVASPLIFPECSDSM